MKRKRMTLREFVTRCAVPLGVDPKQLEQAVMREAKRIIKMMKKKSQ